MVLKIRPKEYREKNPYTKTCLGFFWIALRCRIHDDTFVTAVTILAFSVNIIHGSASSILCEIT